LSSVQQQMNVTETVKHTFYDSNRGPISYSTICRIDACQMKLRGV